MKKMFNEVIDINGKSKKYPADENGVVFFFTKDGHFCIYALYSKRDFTGNAVIEVSESEYTNAYNAYKTIHSHEPTCIVMNSIEAVNGITSFVRYKAAVDNTTIEDLYNLNYKGD